jgi:hypothetical protein
MAEEELILTVRVDDQASAQIGALKASLSQMGTGAQAAGQERVRRQSRESAEGAAHLTREMRGMATTMGVIGGVVGGVTAKITELGLSFLSRVTDVKGYAAEMMKLQQASYIAGTSSAQMQANIDIFRQSGVSADRAGSQIQNFSEAIADMSRVNSETRRNLMRGLRPGEVSDMRAFIDDIMSSDPAEALNKVKAFGEDIRKYQTELYGPEAGARAQQRFYATFGVPDLSRVRGQFLVVSEDQKKLFKDRQDAADRYYSSTVKASVMWDRATASITAVALHLLPVSSSMESIADYSEKVVASLQDWEREFRKTDGSFAELLRVTEEWGTGLDNWVGKQIAALARDVKAISGDIVTAIEKAKELQEYLKAKPEDVTARLNKAQGPEAKSGFEWIQDYATGKVDFYGNPIPLGQQPKAVADFEAGEQGRAGKPTTTTMQPPGTPLPSPSPHEIELPTIPPLIVPPRAPVEPRKQEVQPVPIIIPAPEVPRPPVTPEEWVPAPRVPAPAVPEVKVVPPPTPTAPVISNRELFAPIPPMIMAPPQPPVISPELRIEEPKPVSVPPSIMRQPIPQVEQAQSTPQVEQSQPQPIIIPKPMAPAIAPTAPEAGAPIIVPPREKVSFNQEQPMPSAFASVRNIDLAGTGPAPWMAGGEKGQSQDWMDFASAGAAMDRVANREVNVNGTGKISVDVRAPNGTNVQAQGEGLFRKTEISRQVQMEPAMSGPALPAGAVMAG